MPQEIVMKAFYDKAFRENTHYDGAFCENSQRLLAGNYSRKKVPSYLLSWVLNTPLESAS